MAGNPIISAALIVRDETRYLGDCLKSLAGFADEIVVVDTGSVDDTRKIASDGGALLYEFPWCDDFSAARNFAIDQASGDWILYIDADERVRPYEQARLHRELRDPAMIGATVQFYPRTGSTAYREYRLLRRRPDIRFQGAMHESFLPSLRSAVDREGGYIGDLDVVMDHVGYDGDQSHKLQRNLKLLEIQVQNSPGRIYLWWHLGTVYRDLGRTEDARSAWLVGVELAREQGGERAEDALCFIELAKADLDAGSAAVQWIDSGLALRPENLLLHWLKARAIMETAPNTAMEIFERLSLIDPDNLVSETSYDQRILGTGAIADMGYCAFKNGLFADSARFYEAASVREPQNMEYRLKHRAALSRSPGH